MKNELQNKLPFKLGEQYDNWEFDLLAIGEFLENEISYEVYEFIGELPALSDIKPNKVELLFNADVLEKVVYHFEGNLVERFEQLFSDSGKLHIKLSYIKAEDETVLSYTNNRKGLQLGI